ncbi:hypothetical protein KTS45_19285 [Halomicroarcula limicola]|uniref:Uncharacterized protein n=1 Tax=Haloarcula limicola TaxID=1429915 RepID=A0A8J7Y7X9_9EURY|nr:hypothetical protein [Halomicroarcula limicola]MBV0926355.1 hypothetical protein [Halomicroarcula limicola]
MVKTDQETPTASSGEDIQKTDREVSTPTPVGEQSFQTGNQTGYLLKAISGDTFEMYYEEHDKRGIVKLAAVRIPEYREDSGPYGKPNGSHIDPTMYDYHKASTDAELAAHQSALVSIGADAIQAARDNLGTDNNVIISHTGETTDDGTPLVYIYFDWSGRTTLHNEYVAGYGLGILTEPDSRYADNIAKAQDFAREKDKGLYAANGEDDHPHE